MPPPSLHDWTRDPRAAALLAGIAADPPRCEGRHRIYGCVREDWHEYVGPAVDALAAIRDDHGERALARAHAGDRRAMAGWIALGSVHDVIDAAIAAARAAAATMRHAA